MSLQNWMNCHLVLLFRTAEYLSALRVEGPVAAISSRSPTLSLEKDLPINLPHFLIVLGRHRSFLLH